MNPPSPRPMMNAGAFGVVVVSKTSARAATMRPSYPRFPGVKIRLHRGHRAAPRFEQPRRFWRVGVEQ
jgi:hypothetical protein